MWLKHCDKSDNIPGSTVTTDAVEPTMGCAGAKPISPNGHSGRPETSLPSSAHPKKQQKCVAFSLAERLGRQVRNRSPGFTRALSGMAASPFFHAALIKERLYTCKVT